MMDGGRSAAERGPADPEVNDDHTVTTGGVSGKMGGALLPQSYRGFHNFPFPEWR